MKLHLPISLCCALLACFVSTAQAATYTAVMTTSDITVGTTSIQRSLIAEAEDGTIKALSAVADGDLIIFNGPLAYNADPDATRTESNKIYMPLSNTTIVADVQIGAAANAEEGAANAGLTINDGVSAGRTYTIEGDLSGKGNWTILNQGGAKNQSYVLKGNVANYSGTIDFSASEGNDITFTNDTATKKNVNAQAVKVSDTLTFNGTGTGGYTVSSKISAGTLNVNVGTTFTNSNAVTAETVNINNTSRVTGKFDATTLTKAGSSDMVVNSGSEIENLVINAGIVHVSDNTTYGDVTINGGRYQSATSVSGTSTITGTLSLYANDTEKMTLVGRTNGAVLKNVCIDGTNVRPVGSSYTSSIVNADITIKQDYGILNMDLSESSVTIKADKTLSTSSSNYTLTLGTLTLEAGAKLSRSGTTVSYTGPIALTLGEATFTAPASTTKDADGYVLGYSTNALPGTMDEGAALTLNFGDMTIEESITQILFTFTGLTGSTENVFSVTGWDVDKINADNADGIQLYLSRPGAAAIPEPATATLSLLALAGLAARRRRK